MTELRCPPRTWVLRGMRGVLSVPAAILLTSMAGFGALCRESGLTLGEAVFMTAAIWALPSQVVLVGAIAAGASLPAAAIGVALSAVRFVPMIASWVPLVRTPATPRWKIVVLAHFVAVTSWVVAALQLPKIPAEARLSYFLTALTGSARLNAERLALAAGLVLGPLFHLSGLPLDLVWAGILGGTLAYAGHRVLARRR